MANSGKLSPVNPEAIAREALRRCVAPGSDVLVGLSGGVDSVVLLTVLSGMAREFRFFLRAIHVNHGLSRNAGDWARFCGVLCARLGVPLTVETVDVQPYRSSGLEAAARRARYEAYARHAVHIVVLGQHRDDQAETLILQLLRGAGISGMAAMPERRAVPGTHIEILRPFLSLSRTDIEAHARGHDLTWVEDESNKDIGLPRNFVRRRLMPMLERRFGGVGITLARAAAHLADADELLRQLGREDVERCSAGGLINVEALRRLGVPRTANLLRYLCWERDIARPSRARLGELARQLVDGRSDAHPRHVLAGWVFRRYAGKLLLEPSAGTDPGIGGCKLQRTWHGEESIELTQFNGTLRFKQAEGKGLNADKLRNADVTIRMRQGGERFRPDAKRPRRTLKNLFQEYKVPPWRRNRLPLIFCGPTLVSVPGIGDDCEWRAAKGQPGILVCWENTG